MRVPVAPTAFPSEGRYYLLYELHLTNFGPAPLPINRIELLDADASERKPLVTFEAEQLETMVQYVGGKAAANPKGSTVIAGGQSAIIFMMAAFDHAVSVSMYSVLAMVGALLAHSMRKPLDDSLGLELHNSISSVATSLSPWREQIRLSDWLDVRASYYLLGRGSSLASCHEGRLLWEEAAKLPASAMSTGSFRHGSQEVIREGFRIALWIDRERMRIQDLALADDLRRLGVKVLLIGQDLPRDAGDVVLRIPSIRREWQFLIDIIPIQLAAELLAHAGNQDCDTFRLCQYIVEDEGGIIHPDTGATGIAAPLQR